VARLLLEGRADYAVRNNVGAVTTLGKCGYACMYACRHGVCTSELMLYHLEILSIEVIDNFDN